MTMSPEIKLFAAKSCGENNEYWLPFYLHSLDTAYVMKMLSRKWVPEAIKDICELEEDNFEKLSIYLGMIHDIGKLTASFQSMLSQLIADQKDRLERAGFDCPSLNSFLNSSKTRHALMGDVIIAERLEFPNAGISAVVGAHHGKPQEMSIDKSTIWEAYLENFIGPNEAKQKIWETLWREWMLYALNKAGYSSKEQLPMLSANAQLLLTGLLIMADWIASNTSYFPLISIEDTLTDDEIEKRGKNAWEQLNFPDMWQPEHYSMDCDGFRDTFGFLPNEVQQAVLDAVNNVEKPGIMILEAQMGVGKTEAALGAAEVYAANSKSAGLFFGLPTQATANAIFSRIEDWARGKTEDSTLAMRLAHGKTTMNQEYQKLLRGKSEISSDGDEGGIIAHEWFEGSKQALLSTFVIGTVDQLLMAALKQKHLMMRHLGLAGKVTIIDECHAYDAYMSQYLDRMLSWLGAYGAPVIILSATLPAERRTQLVDAYLSIKGKPEPTGFWRESREYPLLTWTDNGKINQTAINLQSEQKRVELRETEEGLIPELLEEKLGDGGCAGIIVNTVKKAQNLAKLVQERMPENEVILFHSQFISPDRAEKEKTLLMRIGKKSTPASRKGLIVIGTQVLEQSLDIDFDILLTELCPMDLLLQRIGRLHRHSKRERPEKLKEAKCYLINAEDGEIDKGSAAIYGEWLLYRTRSLLPEEIYLPKSISPLVQETYEVDYQKLNTEEKELYKWFCDSIMKRKEKAEGYRIPLPKKKSINPARNTIEGLLNETVSTEASAVASVRDGDPSVEVILLVNDKGSICPLPWIGKEHFRVDVAPDSSQAFKIACCKIRLPHVFCIPGMLSATIEQLEKGSNCLKEWQKNHLLKGELFLLLDEQFFAELNGYKLYYDRNMGLKYTKEGLA